MKEITIRVKHGANFTASGLMYEWARKHGERISSKRFETLLTIGGTDYKYHHWSIQQVGSADAVTLYLEPEK